MSLLGNFISLQKVWESYPEGGSPGDYIYIPNEDGMRYDWDKYKRDWVAEGQPSSGTGFTEHVPGNIEDDTMSSLGNFASLQAVWESYPEGANKGDCIFIPDTDGVRYNWDKYKRDWVVEGQPSSGTGFTEHVPGNIEDDTMSSLGNFASLQAVWESYPEGANKGDCIFIPDTDGVRYNWDKYKRDWVVEGQPSSGTGFTEHVPGNIEDDTMSSLGNFASLQAVWESYPEGANKGDCIFIPDTDGVRYNWDKYKRDWVVEGQPSSGTGFTEHVPGNIEDDTMSSLGNFASLQAVWESYPEGANKGDCIFIPDTDGVRYNWDKYKRDWVVEGQPSSGTGFTEHVPGNIEDDTMSSLGNFASLQAVWEAYPEGGSPGDYIYIPNEDGMRYDWNKYRRVWGSQTGGTTSNLRYFEIVVSKLRHINGGLVLSQGAMTCSRVVEDTDSWQCFFERGENNEISNTFVVNDQARCQVFNAGNQKFYWRLVTAVGDDWIRLSKTVGIGDSIPTARDDIVQLGYQGKDLDHVKRLNAQIIDESGISQYVGIDSFTLEGKRRSFISADGTGSQFTGKLSFVNAGTEYDLSDWAFQAEEKIDEIAQKRSLRIEKWHTPGYDTYREGQQNYNHTLALKIFHDTEDVTDTINIAQFTWMRVSDNTLGDPTWNDLHANAGSSIDITTDDLAGDTSFIVQFYDVETQQRLTERF